MITKSEVIKYVDKNCNTYDKRGNELIIECPFCDDKNDHCHFNPKKKVGTCFKCGEEFNFIQLVACVEGLSYESAIKELKNKELSKLSLNHIKKLIKKLTKKNKKEKFVKLENIKLPNSYRIFKKDKDNKFLRYLKKRGYTFDEIKKWKIGYCLNGYYKNRIIFPFKCQGKNSFAARTIYSKKYFRKLGIKYRKYINPKGSKHSKMLYNYKYYKQLKYIVIVEGVTDVHNLARHGVLAVCTFGKKLSNEQITLLLYMNIALVLVCFDNDYKDKKEKESIASVKKKSIKKLKEYFDVNVINIPRGKDPGKLTKLEIGKYIKKVKGIDKFDVLKKRLEIMV